MRPLPDGEARGDQHGHDRNSLEYCVSWRKDAMSERNTAVPRSSRLARAAREAARPALLAREAMIFCASVWPTAPSRTPAATRVDANCCAKAASAGRRGRRCAATEAPKATG